MLKIQCNKENQEKSLIWYENKKKQEK